MDKQQTDRDALITLVATAIVGTISICSAAQLLFPTTGFFSSLVNAATEQAAATIGQIDR